MSPHLRKLAVVIVRNPHKGKAQYCIMHAMPCGARNCVFVFGHFGRATEVISAVLFGVTTTQYVDDFPQVEPAITAASGQDTLN